MRINDIIREMAQMSNKELFKYFGRGDKDRILTLLQKVKSGALVEIQVKENGKTVRKTVRLDPAGLDDVKTWIVRTQSNKIDTPLSLKTKDPAHPYISLTALVKSADFGGEGAASRERIEQGQIENINQHIGFWLKKEGVTDINLRIGHKGKIVKAAQAIKATPGVKADAVIVDSKGNPTAWISLKHGPGPRAIAGWGGVTHAPIINHPEIQDFIAQSQMLFGKEGIPSATSLGREISDPVLKNQIVFGKGYGGQPGPSNVDAVMAGAIHCTHNSKGLTIFGIDNTWLNGDTPSGGFDPVLNISYKGDRDNAGIPGARISVQTTDGRRWDPIDGELKKVEKKTEKAVKKQIKKTPATPAPETPKWTGRQVQQPTPTTPTPPQDTSLQGTNLTSQAPQLAQVPHNDKEEVVETGTNKDLDRIKRLSGIVSQMSKGL